MKIVRRVVERCPSDTYLDIIVYIYTEYISLFIIVANGENDKRCKASHAHLDEFSENKYIHPYLKLLIWGEYLSSNRIPRHKMFTLKMFKFFKKGN